MHSCAIKCVNGTDLNSRLPTGVTKICGSDMVFSVRLNDRQRCKAFDDLSTILWAGETLEKLLED
jgi:hypothetical protein